MSKETKNFNIKAALYQRRYIFPNLVTIGNLFCGFLAIIYAASGRYDKAVYAVFIGIILDGLDGRVARKLNVSSRFGVEFDSLADLVTFGVAPAFLIYEWCFREFADEFGVLVCFLYALADATRLARFNVAEDSEESSNGFTGLASPAAAAMIVSVVNLFPDFNLKEISVAICTIYMLAVSYLMVSSISYPSIKKIKFNNPRTIIFIVGIIVASLWYLPRPTVFVVAVGYCLVGPLSLLKRKSPEKIVSASRE